MRQNDAGLHHRGHDTFRLRSAQRRDQRRSGRAASHQGGAGQAQPLRAGDVSAAGRMSPVEQVAERQHPARHRARRGALHRLDDGKPARLHDPGHREPVPHLSVLSARRGRRDTRHAPRAGGSGARLRRHRRGDGRGGHAPHRPNRQRRRAFRAGRAGAGRADDRAGRGRRDPHHDGGRGGIHPKAGHPLRRIAVLRHALRVLQEPARQRRGRGDRRGSRGCSTRASIRA